MKLAKCVLPLLFSFRAIPAAADTLTEFFPPDTKVVFGVRVHNLAVSTLAQSFKSQVQAMAGQVAWLKAFPLDGFDLLRDIDEVLLASAGEGPNPASIIVVTGRFDLTRLAEGATRYHGVAVLGGKAETDSLVALLDGSTALLGTPGLVRAAIDQRGSKPRIPAALNDRITSLRQRYDIWGLGERAAGFAAPTPAAQALESIDRFQFGMQLSSGLELGAEIHARSPQDLEKLRSTVAFVVDMLKAQQPAARGAKFDLRMEEGSLKLNVSIPEEALKKALQPQAVAALYNRAPVIGPAAPKVAADHKVAATPQLVDKDGNAVVLTLPGRK
jgi:hypothetical protein